MPHSATDKPILCWSMGRSRTTATWTPVNDQGWSSFLRWLKPDKPAASKEVHPYVGGTLQHGRRTSRTVEQRFMLTLDADYADEDFPLDVAVLLHDTPYLIHTTWRHSVDSHRYRLIIPLDRGVTPNEHKELAWSVMDRLNESRFDKTTAQAERFMWGPSTQDPDTYFWTAPNPHATYLAVDAWLGSRQSLSDGRAAPGQVTAPTTPAATVREAHSALEATQEEQERAQEILRRACHDVEHLNETGKFAGRNEAVFHLMPLLLRFVDAGALDEDVVLESLWEAASAVPSEEPYSRQEFNTSVRSARQYAEKQGPVLPESTPTKMAMADFEEVDDQLANIDDIWSRTDRLAHVAQAADAMGRNRLAMLATLLARILAEVEPGVCLPGVEDGAVGSRAALNLGVALVGSSGQGKSAFFEESERLLGCEQHTIKGDPSTGQGLIQSYLHWDKDQERNVLNDDPRRIFLVDEVDKLGALGSDTGSTLLGEVRTMLTGGSTGSSNATKERQRMLHARTYNFQLVVGVQPARAGALLDGRDAGTPQRFVWTTVTDPKNALHPKDRPPWPGPLNWNDAFLLAFELSPTKIVDYPQWVKEELLDYDYKVSLEGAEGGQMSRFGHQNLLRLKVAAGVAFLHESPVIEDLHVEIADMIIMSSRRVQMDCERVVAEAAFLRKKSAMRSDERARDEVNQDKLKRLLKNARARLLSVGGEWVRWQDMRPAYRDREEWEMVLWEALEADEDVETEEVQHGPQQIRRRVRMTRDTD